MRRPAGLPAALAALERTTVMGVLNVTPDSFSDGGRWLNSGTAIAHGMEMHSRGADIVDVGGESTRPGAERVSASEELRRVQPVVVALVAGRLQVTVELLEQVFQVKVLPVDLQLQMVEVLGGLAAVAVLRQ